MKIAIISFYSGHLERGVEIWTREMATRLSKSDEVMVFQTGPIKKNLPYKTHSTNKKVDWSQKDTRGTIIRKIFLDYWSLIVAEFSLKIIWKIIKFRPKIIIPTDGGWEVAFIRIYCWISGAKMAIVGHSGIGSDEYNNLYSFPDVFVGLSTYASKWAKRFNPFIKTEYIPNGIDLNKFSPTTKKNNKLKKILAVAALEKQKNLDKIIKAVSKIDNINLTVLGEGDQKKSLEKLGKKLLKNRFSIKSVEHSKIYKYYQEADLFISASESRYSFEMVILEALATNTPVVANSDPIRKEIIGDAGILTDPEDTDKFAEDIKSALKKDWGNKPRKQAEKFGWEKVINKYKKLFEIL